MLYTLIVLLLYLFLVGGPFFNLNQLGQVCETFASLFLSVFILCVKFKHLFLLFVSSDFILQ